MNRFSGGELQWTKIKKNAGKLFGIFSDDDPYVSLWQGDVLKDAGATIFTETSQGHFDGDTLPQALKIIQSL